MTLFQFDIAARDGAARRGRVITAHSSLRPHALWRQRQQLL